MGKEAWIENRAVVVGSADQKPDPKAREPDISIPGLETVVLPAVEFVNTPLDVSVELLRTRYRDLASKEGKELLVRFIGKIKITDNFGESYPRIDLHLSNVSLYDAFAHVAGQAGLRLEVTEQEVRIMGRGDRE